MDNWLGREQVTVRPLNQTYVAPQMVLTMGYTSELTEGIFFQLLFQPCCLKAAQVGPSLIVFKH